MARRPAFIALFAALALHVALHGGRAPRRPTSLYCAIELGALALIVARAIAVKRNRGALGPDRRRDRFWVGGDAAFAFGADAISAAATSSMFVRALRRARRCCCATACGRSPLWLTIDGMLAGLDARRARLRRTSTAPRRSPATATSTRRRRARQRSSPTCCCSSSCSSRFAATNWRPGPQLVAARRRASPSPRSADTICACWSTTRPARCSTACGCAALVLVALRRLAAHRPARPAPTSAGRWRRVPLGGSASQHRDAARRRARRRGPAHALPRRRRAVRRARPRRADAARELPAAAHAPAARR